MKLIFNLLVQVLNYPLKKAQSPADPTPPLAASSQTVHTQERTLTSKDIENVWPTCAISLNSVLDSPVITPEGNVYNRNDIVQSLNSNNIDPSTRSPLTQSDLKPFLFSFLINSSNSSGRYAIFR